MTSGQGQCWVPPRTRGSDYKALTMDFMKARGLRPCFKAWTTNGNVVRKNPKGELSALRLEFYCTAQSVADLEYWNRQVRQLRNGKKTGIWRKGDLQLDFRYGIMNLVDLQGRVWTANEWDLLRNGVDAEHGKGAKTEIASGFINQGEGEEQPGMLEKPTYPEEQIYQEKDMPKRVEVPCAAGSEVAESAFECGVENSQGPGRAWEATQSYVMSLSEHRQDMLRVILNDKTIDPEWRDKVASALLNRWIDDDARGGALLDSTEEQSDRVDSGVSGVVSSGHAEGVISEVDTDDAKQNMGEQQGQEFAEDRNRGLSETEVASAPDVGSIREELWPPGEVTSGSEEQVNAIGDQELLVNDVDDIEETSVSHGTADDLLLREEKMHSEEEMYTGAGLSISEEGTPDGEIQRVTGIEKQDFLVIEEDYMGDELLKEIEEECEKWQSYTGENHGQLLPDVMAVPSGSSTRGVDDMWGGYTDSCYRVFEERIGDFGAIDTQDITKGDLMGCSGQGLGDLIDFGGMKEASVSHGVVEVFGDEVDGSVKGQPVVMDDLELEEPVILGKTEIGVDVGGPDVVNEHLKVSDTERSKENPVVGSSKVSGVTMMEIFAGDDVKAKAIGKSGGFQVGGAVCDDSIVLIMSMGYEGCCFQEESMETQRQERDVVDYDYDDGDTTSAKFKCGRPAFAPGEIGMFVVTGRPPGRLLGG